MPRTRANVLHQVLAQLATHGVRTIDTHANEPCSAAGEPFNGRDAYVLCKALSDYEAFAQTEVHFAVHFDAPRFAAAIASCALV